MSIIIGIDSGLTGAIAIPQLKVIFDMPIFSRGKTGKNELNPRALRDCLSNILHTSFEQPITICVILEQVNAMPGQGVTSMFSMGHTFGGIKAVIACLGYELHLVTPQKWKKHFNLSKDKEECRTKAIQLMPEMAGFLQRKKDHNRAEALLIARYGKEVLLS